MTPTIEQKEQPLVGWFNIYKTPGGRLYTMSVTPHPSRRSADNYADDAQNRVACIKITEGQFDD